MAISFRKISSQESFKRLCKFLTDDVERSGGSAGEVVDMHGALMLVMVCKVPWGTLLLRRELLNKLEALAWIWQDEMEV